MICYAGSLFEDGLKKGNCYLQKWNGIRKQPSLVDKFRSAENPICKEKFAYFYSLVEKYYFFV
jgi:hypothetical protein